MTDVPPTDQQLNEIRDTVSAVEPEVSPPLASLADSFVVAVAAKLNAVAPSPAPRSTGVHLALYEAQALCGAGPLASLREEHTALLAEVRRLQAELARQERLHGDTIDDRDRATDMADKLSYAVAPETVIGEHTADNSPWANALELVTSAAEVRRLRAALEEIRHLHKDSPMGPCPVCIDADAVAAGGDGLVPYPCPTGRLAGAEDCDPPHVRAARYEAVGDVTAASLVRDGFGDDEIADMLSRPAAPAAVESGE